MTTSSSSSGGIGFFGLLTIVFIILKLTHYINWSWIWVLSPLWLPVAFVILIVILGAFYTKKKVKKKETLWQTRVNELKKINNK